jgi:hypothetical protein
MLDGSSSGRTRKLERRMELGPPFAYHDLEALRRTHPAWRLLRAEHASLVVGFLHATFITANRRAIAQPELVSRLEDHLFHLRETGLDDDAFPQSASAYLDAWASAESALLRKYYQADGDEPYFDLTPATERAIEWLVSLEARQFVGTESRLMTVFDLLHQIVEGTQTDPQVRIAELERRRAALDVEIGGIRDGVVSLMDTTQIKDRFVQMESTARQLLSDFRQVESNFRGLDRSARERIATWESGKGVLLQEIFGDRDAIADSDQGKSFRAFWDFLMSSARQEELSELLRAVFALDAVQSLKPDRRLLRIHYDLLEAGEVAQRTVARLSEQLRRLLDDRLLLENRRIVQIIRNVEQHALFLRADSPAGAFMELDAAEPEIAIAMDRPLFRPPAKVQLADRVISQGESSIPDAALFSQFYVDKARLERQIRQALQLRAQVSLGDVIRAHPLERGLAEVIAYLDIATEHRATVIDDERTQHVEWFDDDGTGRRAAVPLVIFAR